MADVMPMDMDSSSSSVFSRLSWAKKNNNKNRAMVSTKCCCKFWIADKEFPYHKCKFLHSHLTPSSIMSLVTRLSGHNLAIKGIAFLANSNELYSGAVDKKIVVWDADTGKGTDIPAGEKLGCMIHHGSCIFVGIPGSVKAFDTSSSIELTLATPGMQINALLATEDKLFTGCQDGNILCWQFNNMNKLFEPAIIFKAHAKTVLSFAYYTGSRMFFSGFLDGSIYVWNTMNFQSVQELRDHTSLVTSLLCSNNYRISCFLDGTIRVQDVSLEAKFKTTHFHSESYGFLAIYGMHDPLGNPILAASCMDGSV